MSIEAMKQALEALEVMRPACFAETTLKAADTAITALRNRLAQPEQTLTCVCGAVWEGELMVHAPRNRLAQPEQEPVAWMYEWDAKKHLTFTDQRFVEQAHPHFNKSTPLYTTPPQRPWVGLTDDEMDEIADRFARYELIRTVEAKLKEKNT